MPKTVTLKDQALEQHLARVEQARIDAEFAHMEEDESYVVLILTSPQWCTIIHVIHKGVPT